MTSTISSAAKQMLTSATSTAKVVDLQRDSVDPKDKPNKGLTTDYGIYVSDTDNWSVLFLCPSVTPLWLRLSTG